MCFSATASFGASAILGVIGIIAVAKSSNKSQRLFATIPLIFSIQQLSEGLLWLSLDDPGMASWQSLFTIIYLLFAMAVWPLWIPLAIHGLEKDVKRKKRMNWFLGIGALVAIAVCFVLYFYSVQVIQMRHHLHYEFSLAPMAKKLLGPFSVLYILATVVTPFISGIKKMKWLGIAFLLSYLFAVIFYQGFVVSVWCFFAAILSVVVLWIIFDLRRAAS